MSTTFSLVIDNRERAIIELLSDPHTASSNSTVDFKTASLQVGDIEITKEIEDRTETIVLIERKSIADFYQSVRDGRYREQKIRLLSFPTVHRIYLIEGDDINEQRGQFPTDYLDQLLIRATLKDHISVFKTKNITESVQWIKLLFEKIKTQPELYETPATSASNEYVSKVAVSKKECLTPEVCYKLQLKQIPGVSSTIAEAIYDVAPNWKALVCLYEMNGSGALSEIQLATTAKKSRKLGPKLSEKISTFVMTNS